MNVPREPGGFNLNTVVMAGGFALTIATMLIGLGVVWGQTQADISSSRSMTAQQMEAKQEAINRLIQDVAALKAITEAQEMRLRANEVGQGRTEERLIAIQSGVERIERQVGIRE